MDKSKFMALLSVVALVSIWALGMPKTLLYIGLAVSAILVLNAIFSGRG
jgi:hypothetical protein